jgi:hypothetical protein
MVRIEGQSDYEKLDALMLELTAKHDLKLNVTGWTRKTYDAYRQAKRHDQTDIMARVESFATTNGEITVFDEAAMPFAQELGAALEKEFGIAEAVVVKRSAPS